MAAVGVRQSLQNASGILREVEAGEPATVTVAGRPVGQIMPIRTECWTTGERVRSVFNSPTDGSWNAERREFGAGDLRDPWSK
jgi:prevent-host-death family protein